MNLPSTEEVKEAIEIIDRYWIGDIQPDKARALQVSKNILQAYLSAPVVEEKPVLNNYSHCSQCGQKYQGESWGFNEALRLCRLDWMKKTSVDTIEQHIVATMDKRDFLVGKQGVRQIAQAVSDMLNGGGE